MTKWQHLLEGQKQSRGVKSSSLP